ncbi:hypothetical protein DM2_2944 [Halorubrum sp. DM2]|uniref:hypothetical protein n=1 Tax=Halorubrum sp. DM2 TaxID=2527867 RepID=UPI0024B7F6AB|nr:hypothetical protein [Halorubrum sp. DM2]VTT86906.1 hypothetical protein DM2_2944 [Halorubrum sp. DM2]
MTTDHDPSRRRVRPDPYANPHPATPLSSPGVAVAFAVLPVLTVAVLSFPVAAAIALAALLGGVAGAALHRRYPDAVGRTLRLPNDDASVGEA